MRRSIFKPVLGAGVILLSLVAETGAADFSPTMELTLGDTRANANSPLRAVVKQDAGEEQLRTIRIRIPAHFHLAADRQLTDGEAVGIGTIAMDAGPRCRGLVGSAPLHIEANIVERNRRANEITNGVVAVYVIDIRPAAPIDLLLYGSVVGGWRLEGTIPISENTCPPFTLDITFRTRAQTSGTPILTNPEFGDAYTFGASFEGVGGAVSESGQSIVIQGPKQPTAAAQSQNAGNCKKLIGRKKKRCRRNLKSPTTIRSMVWRPKGG